MSERVKITATTTGKVPNTSATAASSGSPISTGWRRPIAARKIKARLDASSWPSSYQVGCVDSVQFLPGRGARSANRRTGVRAT